MNKKLSINNNKGFQITFENGLTASVQWGCGNYCDNRSNYELGFDGKRPAESDTAEVAVIKNGDLIPLNPFIDNVNDEVEGYLTPEQIVDFLVKVKEYKNSPSINFDDFIPSWYIYTDSDGKPHGVTFLDTIDPFGFFVRVAHRIAFSDCTEQHVEKIFFKGKEVVYAGWQRGMTFEFKDLDGNTVWKESFPHWDH